MNIILYIESVLKNMGSPKMCTEFSSFVPMINETEPKMERVIATGLLCQLV
jgi:hypothetical protein